MPPDTAMDCNVTTYKDSVQHYVERKRIGAKCGRKDERHYLKTRDTAKHVAKSEY